MGANARSCRHNNEQNTARLGVTCQYCSMDPADLYLNLLKGCLTRSLFLDDEHHRGVRLPPLARGVWYAYRRARHPDWRIVEPVSVEDRAEGKDWPERGETMVGQARLDNVQYCVTRVLKDEVPGDLIEAGVWRGGAAILMRAVLAAHGVCDRKVWLADSFEGLPAPDPGKYPGDEGLNFHLDRNLAVGVEEVQANFARYGLLDDEVRFLVGWFKDTLPSAPIEQLAVVRLDGDLYESTMNAIEALYPKLSVGGYLIVDDYGNRWFSKACRQAIIDYRTSHHITEPIHEIDWTGAYWRRER